MTTTATIKNKAGKKLKADGKCGFDVAPFVVHIQALVDMGAITDDADIIALLNPKRVGAADYAAVVGAVCWECGEGPAAVACYDMALDLDPDHVKALKWKIKWLNEGGERAEAKKLKARLDAKAGTSAKAKKVEGLTEDEVAFAYETIEGTFFYRAWKKSEKLATAFRAWAKKAHPDLVASAGKTIQDLEVVIVDEEEGQAVAPFLASLDPALRKEAFAGMRKEIKFVTDNNADEDDEIAALLKKLGALSK